MELTNGRKWLCGALLLLALGGCQKTGIEVVLGSEVGVPGSISQSIMEGDNRTPSIPVTLTNGGTCPLSYDVAVSTANGGNWLSVNSGAWDGGARTDLAAGASVVLQVGFDVVAPALRPGTYTGSVRVTGTCATTGRVAAGSPAVVSVNLTVTPNQAGIVLDKTAVAEDVVTLTDTWTPIAQQTLYTGWVSTKVWTGYEAIVCPAGAAQCFRYDPASDAWSATSTVGIPSARSNQSAVWTGSLMLVWGGQTSGLTYVADGSAYDPALDSWTALPTTNAPSARAGHLAVWTGSRMIVWGGSDATTDLSTGASYDPVARTWTPLATAGAPSGRSAPASVWTGRELLVWGGLAPDNSTHLRDGAAYDPKTNTWRPINMNNAPSERYATNAVWTGRQMLVWGGTGDPTYPLAGGAYDPERDRWTSMPEPSQVTTGRLSSCAVWTGAEMLVWGSGNAMLSEDLTPVGLVYTPGTSTWRAMSDSWASNGCFFPACLWTGSGLLVLSCIDYDGVPMTGSIYR